MSLFIKCSYTKCKSGLPGIIIPIASFLPAPVGGKPVPPYMPRGHAILNDMRLCESCALTADIHQMITDKRWKEICYQIEAAGGTPPDRDTLEMVLGSPKDQPVPETFKKAWENMKKQGVEP